MSSARSSGSTPPSSSRRGVGQGLAHVPAPVLNPGRERGGARALAQGGQGGDIFGRGVPARQLDAGARPGELLAPDHEREGLPKTVEEILESYEMYLRENGNRRLSIDQTIGRLRRFLAEARTFLKWCATNGSRASAGPLPRS